MRPVEENIMNKIEGYGITLYKLDKDIPLADRENRKSASGQVIAKIRYEVQGLSRRQLSPYVKQLYKEALVRKFKSLFK